ncbi:Magnesium-transporting ATPase, P-type 1 [Orchesella cincta]|uniref:Magnesium-transporting ATPase, P-type 1 n=1 Tax=Orchesella cincta TaxID=48709 RepID=A0A1D2N8C7_ORCCI|nr:Magnesium-transporting ATPase, P-type 1 [Orchesella cincta]
MAGDPSQIETRVQIRDEADREGLPLTSDEAAELLLKHGPNTIVTEKRIAWYMILLQALFHPFNVLLIIIAISSLVADELSTTVIISVMILISTSLRFYQEWKSEGAVNMLLKLITKSVTVIRHSSVEAVPREMSIPSEELVPGDHVVLRPGELVPADGTILLSKVFFVSQSALTGEALPVGKYKDEGREETEEEVIQRKESDALRTKRLSKHRKMSTFQRFCRVVLGLKLSPESQLDQKGFEMKEDLACPDHVFMGTQVITGMATVKITRTGPNTLFGRMAEVLSKAQPVNNFQQGVKRLSWMFFLVTALMLPPVFLLQYLLVGASWKQAFIFSLSVAVGLTPEMLPMIVNATLAKGSVEMTRNLCIVKKLDAIINLGAIDVLCTDKTGTLTKSVVHLESHMSPYGLESYIPLQLGFLNSYFQSFLQNPLDSAITAFYDLMKESNRAGDTPSRKNIMILESTAFAKRFSRIDELPFDFTRRRISVLLADSATADEKIYLICKGAVEEMLSVCTKVVNTEIIGTTYTHKVAFPKETDVVPLNDELTELINVQYDSYTMRGQRLLGVAFKSMPSDTKAANAGDESDMIFVGFLCFVDPPKETIKSALVELQKRRIEIKVLTGDAPNICASVCEQIELPIKMVVTSEDLIAAERCGQLEELVERGTIFSKLTPLQKSLVVHTLKKNGHVVGFMGDGINDAPALKEADVGISVDNGVDICRESADVILLAKDLNVVSDGIIIGRKTYVNTIKYIAMAVSSNFGNVFSVLFASMWLPYEPMRSKHLLAQNLLYDFSQIGIPWDTVDDELLMVPHKWKTKSIIWFMVFMGPWSTVFDITTFCFMYFWYDIKDARDVRKVQLFQTTWFTVGLLTQTLIVHMIRTAKIPLFQSTASWILICSTAFVMGLGLALPYIPYVSDELEFYQPIPLPVYYFLVAVLFGYCVAANVAKFLYVTIFKEWF